MNEFIKNLIESLEDYKRASEDDYNGLACEEDFGAMMAYEKAIEIVNQLAGEYINTSTEDINCSTDLMHRSAVIDVIWDVFNQYCNDSDRFDEYETEAIKRAFKWLQSTLEKQPTEEYNQGWIPCSERLPDDFMSMEYLTTVKGHFCSEINYYCVVNHKWYSNERTTKEVNVIAWQPKPAPYKQGK